MAPLKGLPPSAIGVAKRVMPRLVSAAAYAELKSRCKGSALPAAPNMLYDTQTPSQFGEYAALEETVQRAYLSLSFGAAAGTLAELDRMETLEQPSEKPPLESAGPVRLRAQWDEGNLAFKDGRHEAAVRYYTAALVHVALIVS